MPGRIPAPAQHMPCLLLLTLFSLARVCGLHPSHTQTQVLLAPRHTAKDGPQNRRLPLIASGSCTTKIQFTEQPTAQSFQLAAMALAHQITNQPLLSSPPCLPRTGGSNARTSRQPAFIGHSCCLTLRGSARSCVVVRASSSAQAEPKSGGGEGGGEGEEPYEEYEVEILKPYGLKFTKGQDGGTYIEAIFPGSSAEQTGKFTPGDKVLATSAVFGEEIWPAAGYGQTMYCIRQRVGPLYMKMQKKYGKWDSGELSEKEIIRAERNTGNVSTKLREIQMQNYQKKMEQKIQREDDLRSGLRLYKDGKYEEALDKFESVLGSKPEIDESSVASYNVACCYSKLDRIQAGLSALEDAMKAGYEDFKTIRTDPDLANLRKSEDFAPLLNKYDESFINESAINAIKSIFGFGKK